MYPVPREVPAVKTAFPDPLTSSRLVGAKAFAGAGANAAFRSTVTGEPD